MLNPLLLWFLPLALVPIILHLITLRRLKTVELSTFRFLVDSFVKQRRRFKLLEFLLLLLRTAFVVLVVMTLGRPVVEGVASLLGGSSGREVVLVLDAGLSMNLRSGATTSFERAQGSAKLILQSLRSDDRIKIIRAGRQPQVLVDRLASQSEELLQMIGRMKTDPGPSNLPAAMEMALASPARGPRVLYLLTDGSAASWNPAGSTDRSLAAPLQSSDRIVLLNVGPTQKIANLALLGSAPSDRRPIVGLPLLLDAQVVNQSDQAMETTLSVMLDDQRVTQLPISLRPGEQVSRPVVITPPRAGLIRGRLELPADAFPDDDAFLFGLNVQPQVRVLLASGPSGPNPADQPALYIRAALESPLQAQQQASAEEKRLAASLALTAIDHQRLSPPLLEQADVLILANVPMQPNQESMIRTYVAEGGGLLLFPGAQVTEHTYANLIEPVGSAPRWKGPLGNPDDEAAFLWPTQVTMGHPMLSAFANDQTRYFSSLRVYRHFPLILPPAPLSAGGNASTAAKLTGDRPTRAQRVSGNRPLDDKTLQASLAMVSGQTQAQPQVLIGLSDGSPFWVEQSYKQGKVMWATVPATPDWSNLPLKPEFVPLMLRAVAHLRRPASAQTEPAIRPLEPAVIQVAQRWSAAKVTLTDPEGRSSAITLARQNDDLVGAFLQTERPGFYTFQVRPSTVGAPDQLELGLAVNHQSSARQFAFLDEEQFRSLLSPAQLTYLRNRPDDPLLAEQLTRKNELWRTLIWVAFIVIGVEFLLATLRPAAANRSLAIEGQIP